MAPETITINMPKSPKAREEVLRFLEEKGLLASETEQEKAQPSKWAKIAQEMAAKARMRGETGDQILAAIQEVRQGFEVSDPFQAQNQ